MLNDTSILEIPVRASDAPILLQLGLALTLLDLVLAVLVSVYQKRLSSALGYHGLVQKLAFYTVFLFLYILMRWKLHEVGWGLFIFFNGVLLCVILFELSSVKRHLRKLGIPEAYLVWIPTDVGQLKQTHKQEPSNE